MKTFSLIPILFASLALTACGDNESSRTSSSGGAASSLAKYADNVGGLLTQERFSSLFDTGGKEASQKIIDNGSLKGVTWKWDSDRTRKINIGGNDMEFPAANEVGISQFRVLDNEKHGPKDGKSYVEAHYRSISPEEMKTIQKNMENSLRERVAKGEITEEQAGLAGGLGDALTGSERVVETIENIGDACRWTASDNTLAVGHRNVVFVISADISADKQINRDKAIELAKAILAECK